MPTSEDLPEGAKPPYLWEIGGSDNILLSTPPTPPKRVFEFKYLDDHSRDFGPRRMRVSADRISFQGMFVVFTDGPEPYAQPNNIRAYPAAQIVTPITEIYPESDSLD